MKGPETTRRGLLAMAVLLPTMAASARAAAQDAVCALPAAQQGMRNALGYKPVSDDPKRVCSGCAFFSNSAQPPACGKCQLLNGQVSADARCNSWAAKK